MSNMNIDYCIDGNDSIYSSVYAENDLNYSLCLSQDSSFEYALHNNVSSHSPNLNLEFCYLASGDHNTMHVDFSMNVTRPAFKNIYCEGHICFEKSGHVEFDIYQHCINNAAVANESFETSMYVYFEKNPILA